MQKCNGPAQPEPLTPNCVCILVLLWDHHSYLRMYLHTHTGYHKQGVSPFCAVPQHRPVCTFITYVITNVIALAGTGVLFTYVGVVGICSWWVELRTYCAYVRTYVCIRMYFILISAVCTYVVVRYEGWYHTCQQHGRSALPPISARVTRGEPTQTWYSAPLLRNYYLGRTRAHMRKCDYNTHVCHTCLAPNASQGLGYTYIYYLFLLNARVLLVFVLFICMYIHTYVCTCEHLHLCCFEVSKSCRCVHTRMVRMQR